jgi:hypothetical protein
MCPFRHPLCLRNSSPSLGLDSDLSPIMRFRRRHGPQDRRSSPPTCLLLAHCPLAENPLARCVTIPLYSPVHPTMCAPPQSVAIVLVVASFIVVFAAIVNERNRVIDWAVLGSSFFAAAAIFVASTFALRFANQFRLKMVRCGCCCCCCCCCCCFYSSVWSSHGWQ